MKEKTKRTKTKKTICSRNNNKGITLIALILTIIILLILAVVAINAVKGDGIISHAKNAKTDYTRAQEEEQIQIALNEWKIEEIKNNKNFTEFMQEKFEKDNVEKVTENEIIVTMKSGNKYTVTAEGTVEEPIEIGSCVQYNVPYKDMYSGIEYTANNGWRYIGKDDNGNKLIVSTGIPAILYYYYNENIGNTVDGGKNAWWATKAEISSTTDKLYRTDKGYDYNDNGEPNKYAAYGLRYKFESIPFSYQASGTSVSTANTGIYIKVGAQESGELSQTAFRANGVNVVDVHNLTLAELNRATSKASKTTRTDTSTSSGFKDLEGTAKGLFDMQDLTGYTQDYWYWLASPYASYRDGVCYVDYDGSYVGSHDYSNRGVRPVVTLSSKVQLADTNEDGVLEIQ